MGRSVVDIASMHLIQQIVRLLYFTQDELTERDKKGEAVHVPGHKSEVQYADKARGIVAGIGT